MNPGTGQRPLGDPAQWGAARTRTPGPRWPGEPPGRAGSDQTWPRGQGGLRGAGRTGRDTSSPDAASDPEGTGPAALNFPGPERRPVRRRRKLRPPPLQAPPPRRGGHPACATQFGGGGWELHSPEASALEGFLQDPVRGLLGPDRSEPAWGRPSSERRSSRGADAGGSGGAWTGRGLRRGRGGGGASGGGGAWAARAPRVCRAAAWRPRPRLGSHVSTGPAASPAPAQARAP